MLTTAVEITLAETPVTPAVAKAEPTAPAAAPAPAAFATFTKAELYKQ